MPQRCRCGIRSLVLQFIFLAMLLQCVSPGAVLAGENAGACARKVLQAVVHASGASLGEVLESIPDEKERTELIQRFVQPVRFFQDESGYIYVYTLEGLVVGHGGMKSLEGKNLIDHRDARGTYDVRMAIETARKGGGFFEHYWQKPGKKGEFKKITYIEPIPGTEYFIGAGVYIP